MRMKLPECVTGQPLDLSSLRVTPQQLQQEGQQEGGGGGRVSLGLGAGVRVSKPRGLGLGLGIGRVSPMGSR